MIVVCVMAWNGIVHSKKLIESIRRNSAGHNVELVLLDNGSSDGTGAYFESLKPAFLLTSPTNDSIYRGWNRMLRSAALIDPELIVLANNDVVVGPKWLDAAIRETRSNPLRYFLPNGNFHNPDAADAEILAALPNLAPRTVQARAAWFLMFPKGVVDVFLPIPEELILWYGDDWLHGKLQAAGFSCEAIEDCCAVHVGSATVAVRPDRDAVIARDKETFERLTRL